MFFDNYVILLINSNTTGYSKTSSDLFNNYYTANEKQYYGMTTLSLSKNFKRVKTKIKNIY